MMRFAFPLFAWLLTFPLYAQNKPVPVDQVAAKFTLPAGFSATLFAGEPDLVQPIAFTFDDRGRVWVVECLSYPKWRADGTGSDRVTMFEDTDGDGKFDKKQVIVNNGSNLSGIELGFGGIWLCSVPNLVFVPCDFNADQPKAGPSKIILDGWNLKDTKHNIFNSLTWGPDGWLYGCNGIQSKSLVGAPGTQADKRVELNCGVWRYHPTRKFFEAVAHGTTNPFGMDFNERGDIFITNCVIKHLFHFIPGGHYDRMYGQDINPYSYRLMPSIADYIHWAGGDWTTSRSGKPEHSDAGGGHAHSGCTIYLGDNFPDEYRGRLFTCNIHGNRLNTDKIIPHGSGYKSERAPDFAFANDPWFRGIAVKYGPDGGLYVSDWCDTGECHNYDVADTSNGRLVKIVYKKPTVWKTDLSRLTNKELIELHSHKNEWVVRHARRILSERAQYPKERAAIVKEGLTVSPSKELLERFNTTWLQTNTAMGESVLHWFASGTKGPQTPDWVGVLVVRNFHAKAISSESDKPTRELFEWILTEKDRLVETNQYARIQFASVVTSITDRKLRLAACDQIFHMLKPEDATDPYLPLMVWYAVEPLIGSDPATSLRLLNGAPLSLVREFITRKSITVNGGILPELLKWAVESNDAVKQNDVLTGLQAGYGDRREMPMPAGWKEFGGSLLTSANREVRERAGSLAAMFGDETAIGNMKTLITDSNQPKADRIAALRILLKRQKPDLGPILLNLLGDAEVRGEAIRGLPAFKDPATASKLIQLYPNLTESEKEDAVQTLASRAVWALALLDAIETKAIPRKDVSAYVARQMTGLKDPNVQKRLEAVWGQLQPASARRVELTKKYKEILAEDYLKKADLAKGRGVYAKQCAACHKLYDDGGDIGPALTGSQRHNLDYLLENILDPSSNVPREYQVQVFTLFNGRVITGIIKSETNNAVTVRTANDTVLISKEEIEERKPSKMSMMPEGIFDNLSIEDVRNLVGYLKGKEQVPLGGKK